MIEVRHPITVNEISRIDDLMYELRDFFDNHYNSVFMKPEAAKSLAAVKRTFEDENQGFGFINAIVDRGKV